MGIILARIATAGSAETDLLPRVNLINWLAINEMQRRWVIDTSSWQSLDTKDTHQHHFDFLYMSYCIASIILCGEKYSVEIGTMPKFSFE